MIRQQLLLHEADADIRKLERASAANPADTDLRHRLITARERAGHYSPEEAGLHRTGLYHIEALREHRVAKQRTRDAHVDMVRTRARHGDGSVQHGFAQQALEKTHGPRKEALDKRFDLRDDFEDRADELYRHQGRNPLHAVPRHPDIHADEHIKRLRNMARFLVPGIGQRMVTIHPHQGAVKFTNRTQTDLFYDAMQHHYGKQFDIEQTAGHTVNYDTKKR